MLKDMAAYNSLLGAYYYVEYIGGPKNNRVYIGVDLYGKKDSIVRHNSNLF